MIDPSSGAAPVFILSCERSGSTLLRMIIDTHSQIACPAQAYLGPTCRSLYDTIRFSVGQRFDGSERDRDAQVLQEVRAIVDGLMQRYASMRGKRLWCEKTTLNVDFLDILSKVFPDARYLCLYRNSMDVVQSCLKFSSLGFMPELASYVAAQPDNLVAAMAESWLDKNTKILDFESAHRDRCLRVIYEEMTRDPRATLPHIFAFLGLPWEPSIVDKVFTSDHDRGDGDVKVHFSEKINQDSVGRGRAIPLASVPEALRSRIDGLSEKLGQQSLARFYGGGESNEAAAQVRPVDFLALVRARLPTSDSERRAGLRGVCRFVVEGEGGDAWILDLSGPEVLVREDEGDSADCTIAVTHPAFCELVDGTTTVGEVYECGAVSIQGSTHLALQVGLLMFG